MTLFEHTHFMTSSATPPPPLPPSPLSYAPAKEPAVVNPNTCSSVFPTPQIIPISNCRSLSLLVFILWTIEITNFFDSDYNF